MSRSTIIELDRVSYSVNGRQILRDISLAIHPGEPIALLGANGAGKSTLLRLLNGLIQPTQGKVRNVLQSQQAMIFQKPVLLKRSVLDNVCYPLIAHGASREVALQKGQAALAAFGLAAFADRYARTLSGGEQQCLALARASVVAPTLLLADEPTASLAPAAVHRVEGSMRMLANAGTTLVLATHNRGQAKRLASRVLFLHEGSIAEDAAMAEFFRAPKSPLAIEYLGVERA